MNTTPAAGSVAALLSGTAPSPDGAAAPAEEGAFSSALASAAASGLADEDDSEAPLPEGMPSMAALAFLAHLTGDEPLPPGSADAADDFLSQLSAGGGSNDADRASRWTSAFLQGIAGRGNPAAGDLAALQDHAMAAAEGEGLDAITDAMRLLARAGQEAPDLLRPAVPAADSAMAPLYGPVRDSTMPHPGAHQAPAAALRQPVGTPRWADELGKHMVQMSLRGQQEGSLTLSPEHLGPMEVRISIAQDSASVWFGAQHADTRAALADALPRLREMFEGAGLSLGEAGVSQDMPRHESRGDAGEGGLAAVSPGEQPEAAAPQARSLRAALLDTWA